MMEVVTILGKDYPILEERANKDIVQINKGRVSINSNRRLPESLLKEFLEGLLFNKLEEIHEEIKKGGKIDLLGNLDFEITERIDNKKGRIAKLKGNRIILQLDAIALPENILRYIVAHEIAHVENKRHTKKFWKTVELICPNFREAQQQLTGFGKEICCSPRQTA